MYHLGRAPFPAPEFYQGHPQSVVADLRIAPYHPYYLPSTDTWAAYVSLCPPAPYSGCSGDRLTSPFLTNNSG